MDRKKAGYIEGVVSIITNALLFILKFWAGVVTGSIAIIADAWHTLSDSISSIIVIIGVRLSAKKADKEHPFGHGRWEQIAALFIAFLLGIIAFSFLKNSILRLFNHETTYFGPIAIIVTIISIVTKELLAQYAFYVAKKTDNLSIKADGWHHRTDALSSVVVLIGILVAKNFWWMDGVLGIIISLILFYTTYDIAKEAIIKLLGEKPTAELIEQIKTMTKNLHEEELHLHHFHIHNYITSRELTFHIKVEGTRTVDEGHAIATLIEERIYKDLGIIATIHVEPLDFHHPLD